MALFKPATKEQSRLRMALVGPSGSGKTMSALAIASHLGDRIAVVDTEHGSASKYADLYQFDTCELQSFHPQQYINAIQAAEQAGYDVLIIDSLSHAWMGKDGALELVDRAAKRSQSNNSFTAWRDVTPIQNQLVEAMLGCKCHLIATIRVKTEYVMEKDDKGKTVPRKVGLAPVQRNDLEYEFDIVGDMNLENNLIISKSRCPALSGQVIAHPGEQVAIALQEWLSDGVPATPKVNRENIIAQTSQELLRLGWSSTDGKKHLDATYGKTSRTYLSDSELIDFLEYLKSLPAAI